MLNLDPMPRQRERTVEIRAALAGVSVAVVLCADEALLKNSLLDGGSTEHLYPVFRQAASCTASEGVALTLTLLESFRQFLDAALQAQAVSYVGSSEFRVRCETMVSGTPE